MRLFIEARLTDGDNDTVEEDDGVLAVIAHRDVTSAAARLDQFLSWNGVASDERVTVISDDACEFAKTVEGSQPARGRIVD